MHDWQQEVWIVARVPDRQGYVHPGRGSYMPYQMGRYAAEQMGYPTYDTLEDAEQAAALRALSGEMR